MLHHNCADLFQQEDKKGSIKGMKEPKPLDLGRYNRLHKEGKRLISSWLTRAWLNWERRNSRTLRRVGVGIVTRRVARRQSF